MMRVFVLLVALLVARPVGAQWAEAPRIDRAAVFAGVPTALEAGMGDCERSLTKVVLIGAAVGTVVSAVVVVVLSPVLAFAASSEGGTGFITPFMVGSAVVGGVVAGVSWRRACG